MFIELHDIYGNAILICVDDIQLVRKAHTGGSSITVNDQDKAIRVQESVPSIRDLIIKVGGAVAAAVKIEAGRAPIPFKPV